MHIDRYKFTLFCLLISFITKAQTFDGDLLMNNLPDTILSANRILLISGQFDGMTVLQKLFPGKYYNLDTDGYKNEIVSWQCKSCKRKTYVDANAMGENPDFPFKEGIATRLIEVINLSDGNGGQYKILAFNHSTYDPDGDQTGRFIGGLLGLAKFTKTDKGLLMCSFDPAIAAYGAFSNCPVPKVLMIGEDQYAFWIDHENGGAGGPYDHYYFVIAGANGKYKQVLSSYEAGRSDASQDQSNWNSEIVVPESSKRYFRDVVIKTKGTYVMADEENVKIDEIYKAMKGFKSCQFSFSRRYVYSASKGYIAGSMENLVLLNKK